MNSSAGTPSRFLKRLQRLVGAFENQQMLLALGACLPAIAIAVAALRAQGVSGYAQGLVAVLLSALAIFAALRIRRQSVYAFGTIANLLETMNSGDFSLRASDEYVADARREVLVLVNRLANTLAEQNLKTQESRRLLRQVTDQIDVAMIAVDLRERIYSVNLATVRLLERPAAVIVGRTLREVGLEPLKAVRERRQLVELDIGRHSDRFYVYTDRYEEDGQSLQLYLINDIQSILQEEERQAWQNLLRVLSHEINNSLQPIASITDTVQRLVKQHELDEALRAKILEGTDVVKERANSLGTFLRSYQQLTRLPAAQKRWLRVAQLVGEVLPLFTHREITTAGDESLEVYADPVQLQQLLINLIKNADEAMDDPAGRIELLWVLEAGYVGIRIRDQGNGIANPENLFVPLYSTKGRGSGIGLTLCRQIVSNHLGRLALRNRDDGQGAEAVIALPASIEARSA